MKVRFWSHACAKHARWIQWNGPIWSLSTQGGWEQEWMKGSGNRRPSSNHASHSLKQKLLLIALQSSLLQSAAINQHNSAACKSLVHFCATQSVLGKQSSSCGLPEPRVWGPDWAGERASGRPRNFLQDKIWIGALEKYCVAQSQKKISRFSKCSLSKHGGAYFSAVFVCCSVTNPCEQKWQIWPSTSTGTMVFCRCFVEVVNKVGAEAMPTKI